VGSSLSEIIRYVSAAFNFFRTNRSGVRVLALSPSPSRNPKPLGGVARESNEFEPSIMRAARWRGSLPQTHGRGER